jgi:hypothetical protein
MKRTDQKRSANGQFLPKKVLHHATKQEPQSPPPESVMAEFVSPKSVDTIDLLSQLDFSISSLFPKKELKMNSYVKHATVGLVYVLAVLSMIHYVILTTLIVAALSAMHYQEILNSGKSLFTWAKNVAYPKVKAVVLDLKSKFVG